MTSYLVQPIVQPVVAVADADKAAYLAAGWTEASAAQLAAFQNADPYQGHQPTAAPPIVRGIAPPVPPAKRTNPRD